MGQIYNYKGNLHLQGNLPVYGLPRRLSGKESANQYPLENIWQYLLEKKRAMHSSILAWKIPWTEEPRGLQSRGLQKVRLDSTAKQQLPLYTQNRKMTIL